jgi:hypothetical protein
MKEPLDEYIVQKWKKIISKLSQSIAPRSSFFSQESAQLIFIFLFFIIISDTYNVIHFSQTILGHISVVFLLFYFTIVHPMIGAILSMAMILYYHSDLVKAYYYETILYQNTPSTIQEGMNNPANIMVFNDIQQQHDSNKQHFNDRQKQLETQQKRFEADKNDWNRQQKDHQDYIDKILKPKTERFQNMEASRLSSAYPFTTDVQTIPSKHSPWFRPVFFNEHQIREGFASKPSDSKIEQPEISSDYSSNYSQYLATYEQSENINLPYSMRQTNISHKTKDEAKEEARQNSLFRQEHCSVHGQLMNKDTVVKPSMAEFVFPELQIEGTEEGHPCNPCNPACNIRVSKIDKRLDTERILQQRNQPLLQKTSSDWVPSWFDIFLPHPVFQMTGNLYSQPFAKPANKTIMF